jgi:hypothetical protein
MVFAQIIISVTSTVAGGLSDGSPCVRTGRSSPISTRRRDARLEVEDARHGRTKLLVDELERWLKEQRIAPVNAALRRFRVRRNAYAY